MQSNTPTIAELKDLALQFPEKVPYLKMLVLFGSRATGNTHTNSDWDFAVLCDEEQRQTYTKNNIGRLFELPMLIGEVLKINADHIDIVQLNYCSELIAHFVARDGQVLYEDEVKEFENFKQKVLLSNSDIKKIEHTKRKNIEQFLARWGV
ncbi:type VII toxin-antitoxin system MntA family adenylyltransferase antitoxin [Nodularia sp. UHCC 0506]|uniref:type VII toxin-antitoxin system MntA family adenylyltransferase antitoxin n=1 Tax=Nodularia sp. UHCC 0506 TaxID=3110243 RepID=UPI002B211D3D|nr:nucleotidyltransferase domain-containing protein [Nodularia sp. UHCC 0506]MEA5513793.1 nucleotidyltransferase domain-containing protein [Nodularia sp. UHCC 0506]